MKGQLSESHFFKMRVGAETVSRYLLSQHFSSRQCKGHYFICFLGWKSVYQMIWCEIIPNFPRKRYYLSTFYSQRKQRVWRPERPVKDGSGGTRLDSRACTLNPQVNRPQVQSRKPWSYSIFLRTWSPGLLGKMKLPQLDAKLWGASAFLMGVITAQVQGNRSFSSWCSV